MTYSECVGYIEGILGDINWNDTEDCCIQVNMIGTDSGVFYFGIRNHVAGILTGDFNDDAVGQVDSAKSSDSVRNEINVKIVITAQVMTRLLHRVVDPIYAYTTGKYKMMGDVPLGRKVLVKLCEHFIAPDNA